MQNPVHLQIAAVHLAVHSAWMIPSLAVILRRASALIWRPSSRLGPN